ncbi:hypothetical protein WKW80_05245 [Variovorax humicola]|uniref:Uncharacterized protein n=1 Tax=Variovorax humicola TaxID=1769758 RepID=A0ABU8VV31_9BURK
MNTETSYRAALQAAAGHHLADLGAISDRHRAVAAAWTAHQRGELAREDDVSIWAIVASHGELEAARSAIRWMAQGPAA